MAASDKQHVPHTLLLADDSVTIQRVIELTFADEDVRRRGRQRRRAGDCRRSISEPPDIVLADVGMPGRERLRGRPAHQEARRGWRTFPVLLLTGAFEPIDQARAAAVGCDGVLAKPFEPQLVIGRVKELLGRRAPAVPAPAEPLRPGGAAAPPPAPPQSRAASPTDRYFEELDQAFATTSTPQLPVSGAVRSEPSTAAIDWFSRPAPALGASRQPVPTAPAPPASAPLPRRPRAEALRPPPSRFHRCADAVRGAAGAEQASTCGSRCADLADRRADRCRQRRASSTKSTRPRVSSSMSGRTVREIGRRHRRRRSPSAWSAKRSSGSRRNDRHKHPGRGQRSASL